LFFHVTPLKTLFAALAIAKSGPLKVEQYSPNIPGPKAKGPSRFAWCPGRIVIAESWFELWRTEGPMQGVLSAADRYAGLIALVGIFVAMADE